MNHLGAREAAKGRPGPVKSRRRRQSRPAVMVLEERSLLSTFTVTNTADDGGTGTLRLGG